MAGRNSTDSNPTDGNSGDRNPSGRDLTRRGVLAGGSGLLGAALLSGCVSGGGNSSNGGNGGGGGGSKPTLTIQSDLSDPDPRKAMEKVKDGYKKYPLTLNTVAVEQFRAQLPTYLSSGDPPDVITWLAGAVARDYASKGYLLDVSKLWAGSGPLSGYSDALKELSTADDGKQIFVPTSYYWWSIFYRKSQFKKWGVEVPKTWDDFISLCTTLKEKGVSPLTCGTGSTAWMSSGWFDYLDLRVNGAKFHRALLAGDHSFDSPEIKEVMKYYAQIVPFFDPKGRSYSWQEAVTPLVQGKAAMYLIGAFMTSAMPKGMVDDLDFFRVPPIKDGIPTAEEAPTDGYFASSKTKHVDATMDLLSYLAAPKTQQLYIETANSSNLPTSPDVDTSNFSPLVKKGLKYLAETDEITQFFNRDSSDELQTTADTALTKFIDNPGDVDSILSTWQKAAEKIWNS